MATGPALTQDQNLLPVQAYFNVDGSFNTFIGQGQPFYATANPSQSGLNITNSTINSTTIGATTPSTGAFTNISATTGTITTNASSATDIVNYLTLQSYAVGISWKAPVTVATTTNITLSGPQTIDGVAVVAGNTVLVKNQSTSSQNGIYTVNAGAWTYATGCTTWAQYVSALVFVEYGGQSGSAWYCTAQPGGTLGTTAMTWSNFSTAANYTAGTGLTLSGYQFSITPVGTAGTYGSASSVPVITTNASGQVSSVTNTSIAIAGSQITSGTVGSSYISGSYTGITGVGTLTAGTWTAGTIGVSYGGTGATTLTGYVKGSGTTALTAVSQIPTTDLSGTITNAQLANSTISGIALGGNLASLTAGTNVTFSSGTTYNGSTAITINASSTMVYPGAGIPNSTGSAWGTSYSTTGTGTVVALATSPTFVTPTLGAASGTSLALSYSGTSSSVGSLNVGGNIAGGPDTGLIATFVGNTTGYAYTLTQNKDNGNTSYTTQTIANDGYTAYGNFGVNSTTYSYSSAGTANNGFSLASGVYSYAHGGDYSLGTYTSNNIHIITNNQTTDAITINTNNAVAFNGSYGTANYLLQSNGSGTANSWVNPATLSVSSASTATTATNATNIAITDNTSSSSTYYPVLSLNSSGNNAATTSSTKISFVPSTGVLTATSFSGAGAFTTLSASSTVSGTGFSTYLASPPAIGGTTPNSIKVTYGYSPNLTLSDASTIAWDTSTGQVATFTFVSSNRTMGAPTNLQNGAFYALAVIQNGGSNTLTWNSVFKWAGGSAPTLSTAAGAKDYFTFRSDGTNLYEQGRALGDA
jgi:hypothetical protein